MITWLVGWCALAAAFAEDPAVSKQPARTSEIAEMIAAIAGGAPMGPGEGWFHQGQSRYGWQWLAAKYDLNRDGRISRQEFAGPAELFGRLDRNGDGFLTASDFDWSESRAQPANKQAAKSKPATSTSDGPSPEIMMKGLLSGELGSMFEGPAIGQQAPDFALKTPDGRQEIRLSTFHGKKPAVLVFGSFT